GRSSQRILEENYRSVLAAQRMKEALERDDAATFEAELAVQSLNLTEPGESEATAQLRSLWKEHRERGTDIERVKAAADRVLEINQDAMVRKSAEARAAGDRMRAMLLAATAAALLFGLLASRAAIDSLPDPVLVVGVDGALLTANESAAQELKLQMGEHALARLEPEVREAVERVWAHVVSGKGVYVPRGLEEALRVRDRKLL